MDIALDIIQGQRENQLFFFVHEACIGSACARFIFPTVKAKSLQNMR